MPGDPENQFSRTRDYWKRARGSIVWIFVVCGAVAALPVVAATIPPPNSHELDQTLGWARKDGVKQVVWQTAEPAATNLPVYAVQPPKFDPERLKKVATCFHVDGEITPLPTNYAIAPGFMIKAQDPFGAISFSEAMPRLSYASGDEGQRPRDPRTNIPLMTVPTEEEALQKALALLPALGLAANDLERNADGSFRTAFRQQTETYLETGSTKTKEMDRRRCIVLFQRVPGGENYSWTGGTESHLGGGVLEVGFVSEGKVSDILLTFRDFQLAGFENPLSSGEILDRFERGEARSALMFLPESLTITNCAIVYPQGSPLLRQQYLRPTYRLTGYGPVTERTNVFTFFLPVR
jgi:hypothetical protein